MFRLALVLILVFPPRELIQSCSATQVKSEIVPLTSGISVKINSGFFNNSVSIVFTDEIWQELKASNCEYRLSELESDWHNVKENTITFSSVPSGNYVFELRRSGSHSENLVSLGINVHSSLWTALLPSALILAALILLTFIYRIRINRIGAIEKSKGELQRKLADMEMKALRAQMSPHFIFNSLNSINRYIVKSDPETASIYLTKFARLMRLILENSNHKVISLEQELSALKLYVELETLRFNKKFTYTFNVEQGIDTAVVGIPPMVIQPFIENAIWHGLLHKETPGTLSVSLSRSGKWLKCEIADDGVGRKKAAELKSKSISHNKSFGMKITIDRLNLNREDSPLNTVEIIDLFDEFGNAAGTKVFLEMAIVPIESEF